METIKNIFMGALLILVSVVYSGVSWGNEEGCEWFFHRDTQKFVCLNEQDQDVADDLDRKAKMARKLPKEHSECSGRRTLSRDGEGQYSYGCLN